MGKPCQAYVAGCRIRDEDLNPEAQAGSAQEADRWARTLSRGMKIGVFVAIAGIVGVAIYALGSMLSLVR